MCCSFSSVLTDWEKPIAAISSLATVSGSSFSRPPASCPERTRECYPEWRRVEFRPVWSESLRRGDWSRTVQGVHTATTRTEQERDPQKR